MFRILASLAAIFLLMISITVSAQAPNFDKAFTDNYSYKEKAMAKAPKRVFIKEFSVYFQVLAAAQDNSSGNSNRAVVVGATNTTMGVGLEGVNIDELHAITDQLYQEYTARLKAEGFTLVSADEAEKTEILSDWTRYSGGGDPSAAQVGGYLAMTPKGADFFYRKITASGKTKGSFLIDNSPKISGQLGDAIVASVSLVVPFVHLETGTTIKAAQMGSKVKGTVDLTLASMRAEQEIKTGLIASMQQPDQVSTYSRFTSGDGAGATANSYMAYSLKKDVPIPGVVEKKKIVERTKASTSSVSGTSSYNLAGYLVTTAEGRAAKTTHTVDVDGQTYQKKVFGALDSFLDKSLDEFLSKAK